MADAPPTSGGKGNIFKKLDLGKKVGPLPLGAWVVIIGGVIGFYLYYRSSGDPDADIESEDELAEMEDVSVPSGVGEGPGYTYFPPPVPLPSDDTTIRSNKQWARYAIEKTIRETNINNNSITQAVTRYINRDPLNENLRQILQQVFEIAGAPPNPLPIVSTKPKPDKPPPKPPFPTPGDGKWHRIQRGQTLRGIATRYYANPEQRWRDIFNANRNGKDRPGPNDGFLEDPESVKKYVGRFLWIPGPTKG